MRPDEHKARDSRRYQQKKKQAGDSSAAEIALARRKKNAAARDRGVGMAAIRRRNGDFDEETEEEKEERKRQQAKYSKRTMLSTNADRYKELDEVEEMKRDAEMGIDRETTDLVSMLEDSSSAAQIQDTSSTVFKFKGEKLLEDNRVLKQQRGTMFELNFEALNASLTTFDAGALLGMDQDVFDKELLANALNEHPIVVDKPIVPAFSKNAKGYVLFKPQQYQQPPKSNYKVSEKDGIYLRNNASTNTDHIKKPTTTSSPTHATQEAQFTAKADTKGEPINKDRNEVESDELDDLLALDHSTRPTVTIPTAAAGHNVSLTSPAPSVKKPVMTSLPKPGHIKKPTQQKTSTASSTDVPKDDEAWLDELLG